MNVTVYRGTHEIGGTLIEVKTAHSRILLDAGYPLFLNNRPIDVKTTAWPREALLSSGVLPDIKGLYAWDAPSFDAVVISHAHIDHYGLLEYIHESIPVHMSAGTKKLTELSRLFGISSSFALNTRVFQMYQPFLIGDIRVKPYLMDHSAFDAAAFEISAQGKTIIYTGDFRGHGHKAGCLKRFIDSTSHGADVLLIEGTMFGRQDERNLTEGELEEEVVAILKSHPAPVLFQSSSQNIDRLVSFYRAAKKAGRLFVIDVYTANILFELRQLGNQLPFPSDQYPEIKVFYPYRLTQKIFDQIGKAYAKRFSAFHISKDRLCKEQKQVVMMVRPSMIRDIELCRLQNGVFIYSMWQGYRDSESQRALERMLQSAGFRMALLHTSGHAAITAINRVITALEPKRIVPVHTMTPDAFLKFSDKVEIQADGIPFEV